jgi:phage repressor protein C with HTH and peptisase S24 domain
MSNVLISRIKQRLTETGKTPARVSIDATGAKETLRKILDGTTKNPRIDTIYKIARVLETTPEWLLDVETLSDVAKPAPRAKAEPPSLPMTYELPRDVPILGTAAGSHLKGSFQLNTDPIDYARRPPGLRFAKDIYGLYVEGESMIPQFWPSDLIFANPHKPPGIGDAVVIQCRHPGEGYEATIGLLAKRTERHITLDKHNPKATVDILRETVHAVHKIMTNSELFGL